MEHRPTKEADADIAGILRKTRLLFGPGQVLACARIIEDGIAMIADDPARPASIERTELGGGVRTFHLELVRRRRHSAFHLLYFKKIAIAGGDPEVVILRVLHEAMEPKWRLMRALRER